MDDGQQFALQYAPPAAHSINSGAPPASVWSPAQTPAGGASSPGYPSAMFALHTRPSDQVHYVSASPAGPQFGHPHGRDPVYSTPDAAGHVLPPGRAQAPATLSLTQIDSSVGPNRVLTRRQARAQAALQQNRAASSLHSAVHEGNAASPTQAMFYPPSLSAPSLSRPQTPSGSLMHSPPYPHPSRPEFITLPTSGLSISAGQLGASPSYPSTPLSASSGQSPYNFFRHSRSASNATSNPRSGSPALSIVSAMTSASSASAHQAHALPVHGQPPAVPMSPVVFPEEKKKKGRLTNKDRRDICEYHEARPGVRQEDIANIWKVERSTISKIIKAKEKWLAVPDHDIWKVAKHKPSKFPEIEREMDKWLRKNAESEQPQILSDQIIRNKAKEIARDLLIPDEKFKASSGWVENFKHRHGIKRGVWRPARDVVWISPAVEKARSVGDQEQDSQDGSGSGSLDTNQEMDEDTLPSVLQAAWEPAPPPPPQQHQQEQEQHSPPPSHPSQMQTLQSSNLDHRFSHSELDRNVFFDMDMEPRVAHDMRSAITHPTTYPHEESHSGASSGTAGGGLSLPASMPMPSYPPGVMVYPPPLPELARKHTAPQHDSAVPVQAAPSNGDVPDIRHAERSMDALLDFFDAQPEGTIITVEDREKLAQIRCKLFARARGVAYQREDRAQQRRTTA